MIRIALALLFAAMLCMSAQAQQVNIENGSARELKGVENVYVSANKYDKAAIVGIIKKRLPALKIVDDSGRADVLLIFRTRPTQFPATGGNALFGASDNGPATSSIEYELAATGTVMKPVSADRFRRLIEFKDSRRSMFETEMAARFAKIFVRSYKAANKS